MIERCYSERVHSHHKNYIGCSVCDEWLYFSNFKVWMEQQDWRGKQLDKDLIIKGNKLYSPDTCIFIDAMVNSFISSDISKNNLPVGVQQNKKTGSYYANCSMLGKGRKHLGSFATVEEASLAYKKFKKEIAFMLIEQQTDERVRNLLIERYKDYDK